MENLVVGLRYDDRTVNAFIEHQTIHHVIDELSHHPRPKCILYTDFKEFYDSKFLYDSDECDYAEFQNIQIYIGQDCSGYSFDFTGFTITCIYLGSCPKEIISNKMFISILINFQEDDEDPVYVQHLKDALYDGHSMGGIYYCELLRCPSTLKSASSVCKQTSDSK